MPRYSSQNPSIDRVASLGRDLARGEPGETPVTPPHDLINYAQQRRVVQRARGLLRCLIPMPTLIPRPTRIESAGSKPKVIEEYVGQVNTATSGISVAHMRSPEGWEEPGQTPEFDEYTVVLRGTLRVQHQSGELDVAAGQAVIAHRGEWVRYSTPCAGGAEYIAVCLPAFSPATVRRDR
jgi:ethanolamine utilization protein EutQ